GHATPGAPQRRVPVRGVHRGSGLVHRLRHPGKPADPGQEVVVHRRTVAGPAVTVRDRPDLAASAAGTIGAARGTKWQYPIQAPVHEARGAEMTIEKTTLANLLTETRRFPPPEELAAQANVTSAVYEEAAADPLGFWERQARRLDWARPWHQVLDWSNPPFAKWFVGGRLNAAYNCLDRHVAAGLGDRVAFHWEGEPGDTRTITYADLLRQVCQAANALTELGVRAGDRVAIYMPMIPELPVAMLACARIGAPHSVVFGGFSADALAGRIADTDAKIVITADGGYRRGSAHALKPTVDAALERCPGVERVIVVRRTGQDVAWTPGRDLWWHDTVEVADDRHEPEAFDAEHPLFILYTSGTTAKPKGILHTTGGYLTQVAYTHWAVFDLKPETDVYWCTADIGWVTGHSYTVYGPLANAATS